MCCVFGYRIRIYICVSIILLQLIPHTIVIMFMYKSLECTYVPKLNNLIFMFGYVAYFYRRDCLNMTALYFPPGFISPAPDRFLWYQDYNTRTPPGSPSRYTYLIITRRRHDKWVGWLDQYKKYITEIHTRLREIATLQYRIKKRFQPSPLLKYFEFKHLNLTATERYKNIVIKTSSPRNALQNKMFKNMSQKTIPKEEFPITERKRRDIQIPMFFKNYRNITSSTSMMENIFDKFVPKSSFNTSTTKNDRYNKTKKIHIKKRKGYHHKKNKLKLSTMIENQKLFDEVKSKTRTVIDNTNKSNNSLAYQAIEKLANEILLGQNKHFQNILQEVFKFQKQDNFATNINIKNNEEKSKDFFQFNVSITTENSLSSTKPQLIYVTHGFGKTNMTYKSKNYFNVTVGEALESRFNTTKKNEFENTNIYHPHTIYLSNFNITIPYIYNKSFQEMRTSTSTTTPAENDIEIPILNHTEAPVGLAKPVIPFLIPLVHFLKKKNKSYIKKGELIKQILKYAKNLNPEFWDEDKIEFYLSLMDPINWIVYLLKYSWGEISQNALATMATKKPFLEWPVWRNLRPQPRKVTDSWDDPDWWTYPGRQWPPWWDNYRTQSWFKLELRELEPTQIMWPEFSPQYYWVRDWVVAWLIMNLLWIITTGILLIGAFVRVKGAMSVFIYSPFLLVTFFTIIMDVVCACYFFLTISPSLNFWTYLEFAGVLNVGQLRDPKRVWFPDYKHTFSHASWLITGFFIRFIIFWIINIIIFCVIIHIFRRVLAQRVVIRNIIIPPDPCNSIVQPELICDKPSCYKQPKPFCAEPNLISEELYCEPDFIYQESVMLGQDLGLMENPFGIPCEERMFYEGSEINRNGPVNPLYGSGKKISCSVSSPSLLSSGSAYHTPPISS